jgi:hypothetical protein
MNSDNKKQEKKSNFLTGLLTGVAGVGLGVLGAFIYNEVSKENAGARQSRQENLSTSASNNNNRNEVTSDWNEYESFICPICQEVMYDPVITPKGISYERKAILKWLEKKQECPITKQPLRKEDLITNFALKQAIENYFTLQQKNKDNKN